MGLLPLQVWIEILGRVEVETLGHTVDPYFGAQMGLGITGLYTIKVKNDHFEALPTFSFPVFSQQPIKVYISNQKIQTGTKIKNKK